MFFFALGDLTLYGVSAVTARLRVATERHCAGFACMTNCTTVEAPLGCVALPAGDGSVLRQCSAGGAALEVSVYPGSSTCDGGAAPPQTTSYGIGTCYPDNVGGSFVVEACPPS